MVQRPLTTVYLEPFLERDTSIRITTKGGEDWVGRGRISVKGIQHGTRITKLSILFGKFFRVHEVTKVGVRSEKHWEPVGGSRKTKYPMDLDNLSMDMQHHSRIECSSNGDKVIISNTQADNGFFEEMDSLYE